MQQKVKSPRPYSAAGGGAPSSVVLTSVGAILLFFGSGPFSLDSSFSLSLFFDSFASSLSDSLSRRGRGLMPLTELAALWLPPCVPGIGVCGGVHIGTCPTGPELVAATPGTALTDGVCCCSATLGSGPGANEDCVATEEADMDRAGLAGRAGANEEGDAGKADPELEGLTPEDPVVVGVGVGVE